MISRVRCAMMLAAASVASVAPTGGCAGPGSTPEPIARTSNEVQGGLPIDPEPNCEHFASDSIVSSREARGSAGECGVERARSGGARDGCRWRYGEFAGGGRAVGPRQQRS